LHTLEKSAVKPISNYRKQAFKKILDHSGIVWNCWTGALAHLGVARPNAFQSKTSQGADADAARVRALAAYKDFLTLWKDADNPERSQERAREAAVASTMWWNDFPVICCATKILN
jgi:hypothetical protein